MSLELDFLLQPISAETPCGTDCSFSNEFHAIKKAKTQDDPALAQGDWVLEPKQADWAFIHTKSITLLTEKTKDIRIFSWLLESWTHLHGFEGVAKALELLQRSLADYWMQLHPQIEDDDLDQRIGLLQGYIHLLPNLLKSIPIVSMPQAFTLTHYEGMLHLQNLKLKSGSDLEESHSNPCINDLEQFEQALFNTSKSVQYQNYHKFCDVLNQWQLLKKILDSLMGLDAPSFASIDSQLETIHLSLKKIYKADALTNSASKASMLSATSEEHSPQPHELLVTPSLPSIYNQQPFQPQPQNHLENREQAMRLMQEVSDYFQINEPHSPVSYMLQKTIKWSQMPLHEWLTEVLKNERPIENMQELLGVQSRAHGSNNETNSDW